MTHVDAFLQFVVEEVGRDKLGPFEVKTDDGTAWTVKTSKSLSTAPSLTMALNHTSQALDFTSKDLAMLEEPSVSKRVIELAALQKARLVIQAPGDGPMWTIDVEGPKLRARSEAFTLEEAMKNLLDDLIPSEAE